jgi:hypothetical protein
LGKAAAKPMMAVKTAMKREVFMFDKVCGMKGDWGKRVCDEEGRLALIYLLIAPPFEFSPGLLIDAPFSQCCLLLLFFFLQ